MISENSLCYDIETATAGPKPDASKDKLRIFGCYSYKTKKYYCLTKKDEIQRIIDAHRYLIGFNNQGTRIEPGYDNPILEKEGIKLDYKTIIDLRTIFKTRANIIKIKEGLLKDLIMSYSLDFITRLLKLADENTAKLKLDYSLLNKSAWTKEEFKILTDYTKRDLELTRKLYEWTEEYFKNFQQELSLEDIDKKTYITSTPAKMAYKALCKELGWQEKYGEHIENTKEESIEGGFVSHPAGEHFENNMLMLDYNSLYPFIMAMCNIHRRVKDGNPDNKPTWNGKGIWQTEGTYYADELGPISKVFLKWYIQRQEFKRLKDGREYTKKILLNSSYGICLLPYYSLVYDPISAGDITRLGRQWIKYARRKFKEAGFIPIMQDTDSCLVQYPSGQKDEVLKIKDKIISDIKASVPFPSEHFDMKIEADIKYAFFFKGESETSALTDPDDEYANLGYMKKNYCLVDIDGNIIIKNLGIRKKSNSELSRRIFWDYMVPKIREGQIKFNRAWIRNLIYELLEKNITLAALRKDVGPSEQYSKSPTGLQAQLSNKYGAGVHWIIPNIAKIGTGKGKSYCTIEEFQEHNLTIDHIDLDFIWQELNYFLRPIKVKNIFEFSEEEK